MKTKEQIFSQIEDEVSKRAGIQLGERQRSMVESRLAKRIIDLKLKSVFEYSDYFDANRDTELKQLVSLLTTHHTYFFREFSQFEFLTTGGLTQAIAEARTRPDKTIKFWSAACSRGHEVYSLATYIDYHLKLLASDVSFSIFGTDIDNESVDFAANGVYRFSELAKIPKTYLDPYWVRGKGEISDFAKIRSTIRSKCQFSILNLFEMDSVLKSTKFDFIFCRNVFIYFTQEQIKTLTSNMLRHLTENGNLFLGISESLNGFGIEVKSLGPSIYAHKTLATVVPVEQKAGAYKPTPSPAMSPAMRPALLRVLCIDDSLSIQTILKRILTKEHGFEIVATAINGLDATQKMKQHTFDVVTLDIHMPEQDGIEYLRKNFSTSHPPVVMVTSVSREDGNLASEALKLGATDFVEKPTLANFEKTGEEIRTKLKIAFAGRSATAARPIVSNKDSIESDFKTKTITNTHSDSHRQFLLCSDTDFESRKVFLADPQSSSPENFIVFDKAQALEFSKNLEKLGAKFETIDIRNLSAKISQLDLTKRMSVLVFKGFSAPLIEPFAKYIQNSHFIFEDSDQLVVPKSLNRASVDIMPATSFSYMSRLHLAKKSA